PDSHRLYPGNRPSSLILFEKLDPATLGRLIAAYEHKVFVQSVIWDINPFDQWGVQLGKRLAEALSGEIAAVPGLIATAVGRHRRFRGG
ncbi:MAG TPA: hypothetical protein VIV14_02965, partial [Gammaproteobacteria bacterium]